MMGKLTDVKSQAQDEDPGSMGFNFRGPLVGEGRRQQPAYPER